MNRNILPLLKCPACDHTPLSSKTISKINNEVINDGVVWCPRCMTWYPIVNELLELLHGDLVYKEDRAKFIESYSGYLLELGLSIDIESTVSQHSALQVKQQSHFDWYASNDVQTYNIYEQQTFWLSFDRMTFEPWRKMIQAGSWLLDVGCAEGRSTFKVMDLDINVVGFDVSKSLVRQAINRYRSGSFRGKASFFAADANHFPLIDSSFNYVLIYGVLHHLPDPLITCKETARVLKLNGMYFGAENNTSIFRMIFDLLQKLNPLWYEEAGPEALLSSSYINDAFQDTNIKLITTTSVFLPPHLVNLFSQKNAERILSLSDKIANLIPIFRNNGGQIVITGTKTNEKNI